MTQHVQSFSYPDLSNYIHHEDKIINQPSRKEFLLKFYKNQLISFSITLCIYLCGFSDTFLQIVTKFEERRWGTDYGNFNNYKSQNENASYQNYLDYEYQRRYFVTCHRWTYFLFFGLLIVNAVVLVLGRSYRRIVNHQKALLFSQSILLGLTMLGMAGHHRKSTAFGKWQEYCNVFIYTLSWLIANSIVSIILIKINRLEFYNHLKQILIYVTFIVNFIVALCNNSVELYVYFAEIFIFYGFYYYHQLNNSLLQEPDTLPEEQSLFEVIKYQISPPDHQQQQQFAAKGQQQISSNYIVLNKKYISAFAGIIGLGALIYFSTLSCDPMLKFILIFGSVSLIGLVLDTQVASRTLKEEDHYYAAALQFADFFCPLKNINRSLGW